MRGILAAGAAATLIGTGFAVATAAPASAGCDYQTFAQYCDGPLRADGTFERCQQTYPQPMYTGVYWSGMVPGVFRCYPINPAEPWPMLPLGQPHRHLWP